MVTFNGRVISLPKLITIKLWDKLKVRHMMGSQLILFHLMLKQGFHWFTLALEEQEIENIQVSHCYITENSKRDQPCMLFHIWLHTYVFADRVDVELTIRMVKGIYTYHKDHTIESMVFLPWSKTVIPFPSLRQKMQAYKNDTKQETRTWNNGVMPQFFAPQKPSQNPRKCTSDKIRTRWFRHNHWFKLIKTKRYNTLDMNLTDMNKINIIQTVPKRACDHSVDTCTYCNYKAPHPSPIPSDWLSEDWDGEKARVREQRSLIDLNFPKLDQRKMKDSEILKELPIQNLNIQEDRKEEEKSPEITDTLVLPSEVAAVTLMMEETEWDSIIEEKDAEGMTDQEQKLQKDEEEYAIYVAGISKEEDITTETDSEESPYFF